jgi:hypothetical protein
MGTDHLGRRFGAGVLHGQHQHRLIKQMLQFAHPIQLIDPW